MSTLILEPQPLTTTVSFDTWLQNPPVSTEWVDEQILEKNSMTLKHSQIQATIATYWRIYKNEIEPEGKVYTDVPCRTLERGRAPDVAYLTPELVREYGNEKVLPQSFPLIAEIVSPTDLAEEVIAKAKEYLESGGQEVWLVYPDNHWVIIVTQEKRLIFSEGETISTQIILPGFRVSVNELWN